MLTSQACKLLWSLVPFLIALGLFRRRLKGKRDLKAFDPLRAALVSGSIAGGAMFFVLSIPFWGDSVWEVRRIWWSWVGAFPGRAPVVMLATILGFLAARLCRGSLRWARLLAALPLVLWAAFSTPESSLVVMHQVRPPGWKDGVCLQSTGFTCAPAAAATVLSVHGVQTDESEMAARCETRECGTFMADVAKGLGAMLPPHEFSIYYARITPAELRQIHLPCVTCNTSGPRYTHAWVVFRINSDGTMEVGEGGQGRQTVSWQGFTGTFTGETVVIVPKSAPSPEAARVYSELEASGRAIASFGVPSG